MSDAHRATQESTSRSDPEDAVLEEVSPPSADHVPLRKTVDVKAESYHFDCDELLPANNYNSADAI